MLWKQGVDGVMITRISSSLNPRHPYRNYLGDPKTGAIYRRINVGPQKGGFKRLETLHKPNPEIVWPNNDGNGQQAPRRERKPLVSLNVFQEGNRVIIEVQPLAA